MFDMLEKIAVRKIAKVIPSVTAEINRSQTLVCWNNLVEESDKASLRKILGCMGEVIELPENEMGMGSELVSCMPGLIASMFDIICRAAKSHTALPEEQIVRMVLRTVGATAELMTEKQMSFQDVVSRVATKGGITEEGTKVIYDMFPEAAEEMFVRTLEKRRLIAQRHGRHSDGKNYGAYHAATEEAHDIPGIHVPQSKQNSRIPAEHDGHRRLLLHRERRKPDGLLDI
jgi:pyrroline-5-carboxylate reductase